MGPSPGGASVGRRHYPEGSGVGYNGGMERIELLARLGGLPVAAGYVQASATAGEYRIYPAAASRQRWVGLNRPVRFLDGREVVVTVTELRVRRVKWVIAREV